MVGIIHKLSPTLITQIAAGQVIERPSYAVKELVENALDAGATQIRIDIEDHGLHLIRVTDNGQGMSKEDLRECYKHYTTSKIQSTQELTHISSFGFRGEALASIAALSTLTIQSREKDTAQGIQIQLNAGEIEHMSATGMPEGTIVTVENLFATVPVRKKFLKKPATELRHTVEVMSTYALAFPQVGFLLTHNARTILQVPPQQEQQRIAQVLGERMVNFFLPLRNEEGSSTSPYSTIRGYISHPQAAGSRSVPQYIFVNQRPVVHPGISVAIKAAYGTLLEPRAIPPFILFFSLPFEMIDVNVHPRKEQISLHNSQQLIDDLTTYIRDTLQKHNLTFADVRWYGKKDERPEPFFMAREGGTRTYAGKTLKKTVQPWEVCKDRKKDKTGVLSVLQVHDTFLIAQTEQGILMIDQHAAHERILYEQFRAAYQERKGESYQLTQPVLCTLSPVEAARIREHEEVLASLGFCIEEFGEVHIFKISAVPTLLQDKQPDALLQDVLNDLGEDENPPTLDARTHRMLSYLACRSAIKAGDPLTEQEARALIAKLRDIESRYTCPHGRPVQVEISLQQLYRMFRRT